MPEFRDLYCDFQDSIKFYIFLLDGSQTLGLSNFSIFIDHALIARASVLLDHVIV